MRKIGILLTAINFLFLACNIVFVSCQSSGAASDIASSDIAFDNTHSGLSADNIQDAIDELANRLNAIESNDIANDLVGTWTGNEFDEDVQDLNYNSSVSITFNSDGTYSCTSLGILSPAFSSNVCSAPVSWSLNGKILKISYSLPGGFTASGNIWLPIQSLSNNTLTLLDGSDDVGMRVMILSKS